jgi:hypothetical protein
MKSGFNIIIFAIFVLSAFCISSCTTGLPSEDEQTDKSLIIDMGSYSVAYPVGDDWSCRKDKFNKSIQFSREKCWWTGVVLGETNILIYENVIKSDTLSLTEKQTADEYRNEEIKNLKQSGQIEPEDQNFCDTMFNGKKFYCLSYGYTEGGLLGMGGKTAEVIMALHFPSNFREKHTFYVFMISDFKQSDALISNDATQLYPVLKSFNCKITL